MVKSDKDIVELHKKYLDIRSSKEYRVGNWLYSTIDLIKNGQYKLLFSKLKSICLGKKYAVSKGTKFIKGVREKINISDLRIAVYTVLIGNYDDLKEPIFIEDDIDYFVFTDIDVSSESVWKKVDITIIPEYKEYGPYKFNRFLKILPYMFLKNYDYTLYVDASAKIVGAITPMIECMGDCGFGVHLRENIDCVYSEGRLMIGLGWSDKKVVEDQLASYKAEGFPPHYGVFQNAVLIRKHSDMMVKTLMELWWQEYCKYPTRDQISLPYVMWKLGFDISCIYILGDDIHRNPRFMFFQHKNAKGIRADK